MKKEKDTIHCKLIIIQCDMGCITEDLIACARNRTYDMRAKAIRECKTDEVVSTHVLFIIYIPVPTFHSSLVGFQGDPWISAHIDEIRPTSDVYLTLDAARNLSLNKFFYGPLEDDSLLKPPIVSKTNVEACPNTEQALSVVDGPTAQQIPTVAGGTMQSPSVAGPTTQVISTLSGPIAQVLHSSASPILSATSSTPDTTLRIPLDQQRVFIPRMYTQCSRLHICIQAAVSRLVYLTPTKMSATKRVQLLTELIPRDPKFPIGMFVNICVYLIIMCVYSLR